MRLRANEALFLPCVHSAAGLVVALGGIHRIEENLVLLTLLISRLLASVSTAVDDQIPIKCFLLRDTRSARLNKVFFFFSVGPRMQNCCNWERMWAAPMGATQPLRAASSDWLKWVGGGKAKSPPVCITSRRETEKNGRAKEGGVCPSAFFTRYILTNNKSFNYCRHFSSSFFSPRLLMCVPFVQRLL